MAGFIGGRVVWDGGLIFTSTPGAQTAALRATMACPGNGERALGTSRLLSHQDQDLVTRRDKETSGKAESLL